MGRIEKEQAQIVKHISHWIDDAYYHPKGYTQSHIHGSKDLAWALTLPRPHPDGHWGTWKGITSEILGSHVFQTFLPGYQVTLAPQLLDQRGCDLLIQRPANYNNHLEIIGGISLKQNPKGVKRQRQTDITEFSLVTLWGNYSVFGKEEILQDLKLMNHPDVAHIVSTNLSNRALFEPLMTTLPQLHNQLSQLNPQTHISVDREFRTVLEMLYHNIDNHLAEFGHNLEG